MLIKEWTFVLIAALILSAAQMTIKSSNTIDIDAFDYLNCGWVYERDWEGKERAFDGCKEGNSIGPTKAPNELNITGGDIAQHGEFPSFAQLFMTITETNFARCGGTIIHNNLLITAAHCVIYATRVFALMGTQRAFSDDGTGAAASQWCWPKDALSPNKPRDVAVIKLDKEIKYHFPDVYPACLNRYRLHRSDAKCAITGFGIDRKNYKTSPVLKMLVVKRNCTSDSPETESCYVPTDSYNQTIGDGDSGSGVFCWDWCSLIRTDRTFVVGAVSNNYYSDDPKTRVGDFQLNWPVLEKILNKIINNSTEPDVECSYAPTDM